MGISAAIDRFSMPVLIAVGLGPLTGGLAAGFACGRHQHLGPHGARHWYVPPSMQLRRRAGDG